VPRTKAKKKVARRRKASETPAKPAPAQPAQPDYWETLDRVRRAANAGNAKAVQAIRDAVKNVPEVVVRFGDAAKHVESAVIEAFSGGELLTEAAIAQHAEAMYLALVGETPSVLVELTARRVVLTWLELQHSELQFLRTQQDLGWAKYWLHRRELSDKLYRNAIKAYLTVQRLLPAAPPAIQQAMQPVESNAATIAPNMTISANDASEISPAPQFNGVNRISRMLDGGDLAADVPFTEPVNDKPHVNGYNRLSEFFTAEAEKG
jgi:hypothetical protein